MGSIPVADPFKRGVQSHGHAPTHAQVFRRAINRTQIKLLATRFSYIIACV